MNRPTHSIFAMATLVVAMLLSHTVVAGGRLVIDITNRVGPQVLSLDSGSYTNALAQPYTVSMFKYYIGKIALREKNGSEVRSEAYYLVNESEPASKTIVLEHVPIGDYTGISFFTGVDSADNCSGAQDGALDPLNAMFWAWNTGYIFLKLEGRAPASRSSGHLLEYHIGGYREPHNCIRHIALRFKKSLPVVEGGTAHVHLNADVAAVLSGKERIDFAQLSSVTDFHNATTIADNYATMWSVSTEK